LLNEIIDTN